ncbi:hypothetical protein ATKI12_8856 [Kitasatospora sp. Ki12]
MVIDRTGLAVLTKPRVAHLLTVSFISTITRGAVPLALLVALASVYGFGVGGLIDGVYTLLLAGLGPFRARALDMFGQRAVLLVMGALSLTFQGLIVLAIAGNWPWFTTLALIIAAGMTSPPLGSALRVSWRQAVDGPEQLKVVHSANSIIEELGFVVGPAAAGLGFALFHGGQGAYRASVLAGTASLLLYLAAASKYQLGHKSQKEAPPVDAEGSARLAQRVRRWLGPLSEPPMIPLVAPLLVMGLMFGGLGVFIPAYTRHLDMLGWSGPIISLISVGGVVGGIAYGALRWETGLWQKYRSLVTGFALPCCLLPFATTPWVLGVLLLLAGLFVTPIFSSAYLLVDDVISQRTRYEANAWVGSSTDLANGASAIAIGYLVAREQWRWALIVLGAVALLCLALLRLWRVPRTTEARQPAEEAAV